MAIRTDQYTNSLTVVDTVTANAPLNLIPQGTGVVTIPSSGQNLMIRSVPTSGVWSTFSTGPGAVSPTVTYNAVAAPDSTTTAAQVVHPGNTTSNVSVVVASNSITLLASTYTASVFLRGNVGGEVIYLIIEDNFSFVVQSCTLTTTWQRFSVSGLCAAGTNYFVVGGWSTQTGATAACTYFVWGAQVEFSSRMGTFVPTSGTAIYNPPNLSFNGVAGLGLQLDGSVYATSAGNGNVRLYTNNTAQEQVRVSHTASAVNYVQATGAATGSGPTISAQGSDTNADLNLTTKGTGAAYFRSGNGILARFNDLGATVTAYPLISASQYDRVYFGADGTGTNLSIQYTTKGSASHIFATSVLGTQQASISHTASAVNYVNVTGATTGNPVLFISQGSDASVPILFNAKGANGYYNFTTANTGNSQLVIMPTSSAVNQLRITGSITGFGPRLYADGSDTNIPLVLQPKGTGALQAQQTDSTATGGNTRGAYAIDFQTTRGSASQVASGLVSFIGGGQNNTASGAYAVISGGYGNTASGTATTLVSGSGNTATGPYSGVLAGYLNTISGYFSFIGAGASNSTTSSASVTTQSATMNGTTAVTLSASNASIKVGQFIQGTSINFGTYVAAISGTSLTLSAVASGSSTSTLTFYTPHGVVVGGGNNQATGSYSFIGGGGDAGTAGNRNVASGDWSVVVGGHKNTASGTASFVGGGGIAPPFGSFPNTASSAGASVVGGFLNTASNQGASIGGGYNNLANGVYSAIMGGNAGTTRVIVGNHVFPACSEPMAGTVGASQAAMLVLARQTTDATPTVLASTAAAATTSNQVIMPNNSAYFFTGEVVAGVTGGGDTKGWTIEGVIKRGANAASTALVGTPTVTSMYADVGAATWAIAVTADTTNGGLAVTFTGQLATTIRVVCQVRTTEMTF